MISVKNAQLALDPGIDPSKADLTQNLKLQDPNIQKSGDLLTLKYEEVEYLNQPHATNVENVNPFNVIIFVGGVVLDPASDNWVRTIYINDHRTDSTGAEWKQEAKTTRDVIEKPELKPRKVVEEMKDAKEQLLLQLLLPRLSIHQPKDLLESLIMLKM